MSGDSALRRPCYCWPGTARCDDPYNWCDRAQREAADGQDGLRDAIVELLDGVMIGDGYGTSIPRETAQDAADAVLALPEIAALRAKAAAADRVRELADALGNRGHTDGREIRRALDGDGSC